ncbi:MAG: (Fe-S)-binding protein [Candidatus Helarchaeota archaeon]|nr:(Fe-S)-binding protein [Candidatus Helarchaeota archaeon]
MTLEKYYYDTWECARCSQCKWIHPYDVKNKRFSKICPSVARYLFDAYSAQGKMDIVRSMVDGELKWEDSPRLLDIIYQCTSCGACDVMCKRCLDIEPLLVMEELRIKCVEDGIGPMPKHKTFAENTQKNHNPYGEPHEERFKWMPNEVKPAEKAEIAYFVGCTSAYRRQEIAEATVKILKASGTNFVILGPDEWCCGSPLIRTGQVKAARELMEHNVKALNDLGVNTVITACAGCYEVLKVDYPKAGIEEKFTVMQSTEYILQLLKDGKLELKKEIPMKVTYHDPCHLGRGSEPYIPWEGTRKKYGILEPPKEFRRGTHGVYEPPRDVLKKIGIELVEMDRIKEYAWCCGAGGGVKSAFPDFALWTAKERVEEAKATGAPVLVTSCPFCVTNLDDAVKKTNERIEVLDIMTLVLKAIEDKGA